MLLLILLVICVPPPQNTWVAPPQTKEPPLIKTCPCSPLCTCGCNEGKVCKCNAATKANPVTTQKKATILPSCYIDPITGRKICPLQP